MKLISIYVRVNSKKHFHLEKKPAIKHSNPNIPQQDAWMASCAPSGNLGAQEARLK